MKNFVLLLLTFLFVQLSSFASHLYLEKDYQNNWCKKQNGQTEYILNDKTRIDCLTKDYAIEFDFASKWAESVGQSLYYALATGKRPGIVLIMENPIKDKKYLIRLNEVANKYCIKVWTMTPEDMHIQRNCDR